MKERLLAVSLPDLFYSLIFIIFISYLKKSSKAEAQECDKNIIQVNDFSIEVSNFPQTIVNETEIFKHFSQFGEVIEAKIARNYYGTLLNHKKLGNLETKLTLMRKKVILITLF